MNPMKQILNRGRLIARQSVQLVNTRMNQSYSGQPTQFPSTSITIPRNSSMLELLNQNQQIFHHDNVPPISRTSRYEVDGDAYETDDEIEDIDLSGWIKHIPNYPYIDNNRSVDIHSKHLCKDIQASCHKS